jgi:hypothetical protein
LEHFKKLQGNMEFYQNKCQPGNAPDTRRTCAKATDMSASGLSAGQTPWLVGPTLQPPMSFIRSDALQEAVEWNPRPVVGGGRAPWLTGHVARPPRQHMVNYRLNQVGNCSWDSNKYPLCRWNSHTTFYL